MDAGIAVEMGWRIADGLVNGTPYGAGLGPTLERIADALERQAEAQELLAVAISEANVVEGFRPESAAGVLYNRIRARHEKGGM